MICFKSTEQFVSFIIEIAVLSPFVDMFKTIDRKVSLFIIEI